jgi:hypothetical protein
VAGVDGVFFSSAEAGFSVLVDASLGDLSVLCGSKFSTIKNFATECTEDKEQ